MNFVLRILYNLLPGFVHQWAYIKTGKVIVQTRGAKSGTTYQVKNGTDYVH